MECCGLLLGTAGPAMRIDAVAPAANVAPDPARHFEVDPAALIAAHRRARAGGPALLGAYHSHPTGDVRPSATDAAAAEGAGELWLIIASAQGNAALWRARPGGHHLDMFDPVEMIVVDTP